MARFVVFALLLAAVVSADADNFTYYFCGRAPSSEADHCKYKKQIWSQRLDNCTETKTTSWKAGSDTEKKTDVVITKYKCDAYGMANPEYVKEYEKKRKCKTTTTVEIDKTATTTTAPTTSSTTPAKKDTLISAKLHKISGEYKLQACPKGSCQETDEEKCTNYTIDVKKGAEECTSLGQDGFYYKVSEVTEGNELYHVALFSSIKCKEEDIVLQGEFLANDIECTTIREEFVYTCEAPANYKRKSCGYVQSTGDCDEATKTSSSGLLDVCENSTYSIKDPASYMYTCSDGKVARARYSNDSCDGAHLKETTIDEERYFSGETQYLKLGDKILYICDSEKECKESNKTTCTNYTLKSAVDDSGKCKLQPKEKTGDTEFSYKAKKNGDNKYHLALYADRKCSKNIKFQGELTVGKCVKVREALKTECSGAFATATLLAGSILVAAVSVLF